MDSRIESASKTLLLKLLGIAPTELCFLLGASFSLLTSFFGALVEYSGRLFRNGKAQINAGVKDIFERLGTSEEYWGDRIKKAS